MFEKYLSLKKNHFHNKCTSFLMVHDILYEDKELLDANVYKIVNVFLNNNKSKLRKISF